MMINWVSDLDVTITTVGMWIVTALVTLTYLYLNSYDSKKYDYPLPPLAKGGMFRMVKGLTSMDFHYFCLQLFREEAKILRIPMKLLLPRGIDLVFVSDANVARKVLEHPNASRFCPAYQFFNQLLGGQSFFTSEDEKRYKHPRKSILIGVGQKNLGLMRKHIDDVVDSWMAKSLNDDSQDILIAHEMQKCTIQSISKIAFDYDISDAEQETTIELLKISSVEAFLKSDKNPLRKSWLGPYIWSERRRADKAVGILRTMTKKMLEHSRARKTSGGTEIFIDLLKSVDYEEEDMLSDMVFLYAAGFDTTGYTISFALLELARNPEIQSRLREELRQQPKDERINTPLLRFVLKETLRLWPVAASGPGRLVREDIVYTSKEEKRIIPKGMVVVSNLFGIHRDIDTFDRPDEFVPSRWENPTKEMNAALMGFSVGRRNCPGQLLAVVEAETFIARLVAEYEWSIKHEEKSQFFVTLKNHGTVLTAKKLT